MKNDKSTSYMKIWHTNLTNKTWKSTEYQKVNAEGIVLNRYEMLELDGNMKPKKGATAIINIHNQEGDWSFRRNVALLHKFKAKLKNKIHQISQDYDKIPLDKSNSFSISEVEYHGRPSFKVKMVLSDELYQKRLQIEERVHTIRENDLSAVEKAAKNTLRGGRKKIKLADANDNVGYLYEFILEKNSNIIWSQAIYLKSGDLLDKYDFIQIEFNIPLSDDIFEIPKGVKKVVIESPLDLFNYIIER